MWFLPVQAALALLYHSTSTVAAPTDSEASTYACTTFLAPVNVTNVTTIVPPFSYPFSNGYAATALGNSITSRDAAAKTTKPKLSSVTKTFNISLEYCAPKTPGPKASTVQLLTHGLGFDKSYWDFKVPRGNTTEYSYIHAALSAGYSTLSWDRPGCGASTDADPYTEIQGTVELALLTEITAALREGKISSHIPVPKKVIHVGHSWGSQLSNALAASFAANTLSDGLVLTGYSHLTTYQPLFFASTSLHLASTNQPARFAHHSSGYVTWPDRFANQYAFFAYPYFAPAVLEYAESTKFPFTVGELISGAVLDYNATGYAGPVLYLEAQYDLIFCGGDCEGNILGPESVAVTTFEKSSSVEVYVQPKTGHAINLHSNATAAFGVVMEWASRMNL